MSIIDARIGVAGRPEAEEVGHPALLVLRDPRRIAALRLAEEKTSKRGLAYARKVIQQVAVSHDGTLLVALGEDGYTLDGDRSRYDQDKDRSIQVVRFKPELAKDAVSPQRASEIGTIAVNVIQGLVEAEAEQRDRGPFSLDTLDYLALPAEYIDAYSSQPPGDYSNKLYVNVHLDVPELSDLAIV